MKAASTQSVSGRTSAAFQNVLVCGSPQQDAPILLEQALPFLRPRGSTVRLLELPERPQPPHAPRGAPLARVVESLNRLGVEVQRDRSPASADAILRKIAGGGYDLVIKGVALGDYGRRTLDALDQQLVERCPVLVWLAEWAAPRPVMRVLAAIDPGAPDRADDGEVRRRALAVRLTSIASDFADLAGAELHVLHAWSAFGDHLLRARLSQDELNAYISGTHDAVLRTLHDTFDEAGVQPRPDHLHVVKGSFEEVAPRLILDFDIDVVVIGTKGRTGWLGPVVQPHAEGLLCNTRASVLVVKKP